MSKYRPRIRHLFGRVADALCAYFRVDVRGIEHVPKRGPVIVIANHSGVAGEDAIILSHLLRSKLSRDVRVMAHPFYFETSRTLRSLSFSFGLREPRLRAALRSLKHGRILIVFPEGAQGNFKSSLKRYRLRRFHAGFVRMALATGAPIIPCTITGAEESHWNLGSVNLNFLLRDLRLPVPLNLVPLPAKWRIHFFAPIHLHKTGSEGRLEREAVTKMTEKIRSELQNKLTKNKKTRPYVYFPRVRRRFRRRQAA